MAGRAARSATRDRAAGARRQRDALQLQVGIRRVGRRQRLATDDVEALGVHRHRADGQWQVLRTVSVPPEPAETEQLPPALQPFGAVPPLSTDQVLSLDDRFLFLSCWGTGELKAFDVTDPLKPVETGSVRIGGIGARTPHPAQPDRPLNGGPQMVEASRDGKRLYFTNSLYATWDAQFYPDGIRGWMAKLDVGPDGGCRLDPELFLEFDGLRPHQVHLEGGDASSDSYCFS